MDDNHDGDDDGSADGVVNRLFAVPGARIVDRLARQASDPTSDRDESQGAPAGGRARAWGPLMAGDAPEHLVFVRSLPCSARSLGGCVGAIEAHHVRDHTGLALRSSDLDAIPLCRIHHHDVDQAAHGVFSRWPLDAKKAWMKAQIEKTRRARASLERWL